MAFNAASPGVLLVGVFATMPDQMDPKLALPGGLHPCSRRLLHCWMAAAALPEALSL